MSALAAHAIYAGVAGGTWKPSIFSLGVLPGAKHQSRIDMGPGGCPDGGHPTANSYHRLVPGFEAPVNLVYSQRNRSACVRIPITGSNPNAKRLEFRVPDPSSNPYIAFSAMLMAGVDGIRNKIEPPEPIDKDLY